MHVTKHAREKYSIGRTRLRPSEIATIVEAKVGIDLGAASGYRFFYFYSIQDNGAKIAVIDERGTALISIWGGGYTLPDGVRRPNNADFLQARSLVRGWLGLNSKMTERRDLPCNLDLEGKLALLVIEGKATVYRKEYATTLRSAENTKAAMAYLGETLTTVASAIDGRRDVSVVIRFISGGKLYRELTIKRFTLKKLVHP